MKRQLAIGGIGLALLAGSSALTAFPVMAQSLAPGAVIELGPVELDGGGSARARFALTPGAVDLVETGKITTAAAPTLADALKGRPGVVVQEFFGGNDQPRIQIRGSGQQQNPAERGLLVLSDGMPVNRADGSYVVGLASPGSARSIEVFRGTSANRLGAAVLGGALNFTSPSGEEAPGFAATVSAGSFGRRDARLSYGMVGENHAAWLFAEHSEADGFRDYNSSERTAVGGNLTFRTGAATTRLFFRHTDLAFDVAGPLTWAALQSNPKQNHIGPVVVNGTATNPGPNVLRDRPHRDTTQTLLGLRSTWESSGQVVDVGLSAARTDDSFAFPISAGFRDTDGHDATLTARYSLSGSGLLPLFEAGLSWSKGASDRDYAHNIGGVRGAVFGKNRLRAETLSLHAGGNIELGRFTLSPSVSFIHARRENRDLWGAAPRPTAGFSPMNPGQALPGGAISVTPTDYNRSYSGFAPSLALSWAPVEDQFAWVSLSRSFEPPTHDDLIGTVGGTPNSGPGRPNPGAPSAGMAMFSTPDLKAQTAVTLEAGWRGQAGGIRWDATAYHARLKNELLSLRDTSGAAIAAMNAGRTTHSGLELGASGDLAEGLSARLSWTWQDFRFDNDPLRGNNRLAGAPEHVVSLALDWQASDRLSLGSRVHWVPGKTPVDNMNTVFNRAYALVDLSGEYRISDKAVVFAAITNVFDERYAASTLVVDQASPLQAAFIPGAGRALSVGARLTF